MGVLTIQLKEGKNIEAKDSGTAEVYVKFRVLSQNDYMAHLNDKIYETSSSSLSEMKNLSASDVISVAMKGKSKSVKKSPNPVWNDTIVVQMPNSPKGFHLLVDLVEKNFIGSNTSMGENIVGLDDLKDTKDFWINIGSGSLHILLTHKADFKSKVNIFYQNELPFIYELLRGVKLNTQLDVLCQLVKVKERAESFVLQLVSKDLIITDQHLNDPNFELPDGTDLKLMLRPNLQVTSTLDALKNEQLKKKAIFDLKTLLQTQAFAEEFLAQGGITAITDLLFEESQRNTVAYALIALDSAMTYGIGWDHLSLKVIEKILSLTDSPNLNVKCGAIKIIGQLATSKNHGYPLIMGAIKKTQPDVKSALNSFYSKIISNFSSVGTDVNIQFISLSFLNNMLTSAPDVEKEELFKVFDGSGLTKYLRNHWGITTDVAYKTQIFRYLKLKNDLDNEPQPYNKENKEHEKLLLELWTSVFPDVKLETRVSEQWKIMGFQGCDPATDFRGMGLLGLKHLLYFATHYTTVLRGMMEAQAENNDTYYPIAVAGINLSKVLYEMFRSSEDKQTTILFDHEHAVPEIYCIALQFFDRTWDEMGATYFNFSNVIREVEGQLLSNLSQANTIEQFKLLSLKAAVEIQDKKEEGNTKKKKGFLQTIGLKGSSSSSMRSVVPQAIMGNKGAAKQPNYQVIHEAVKSGNTKKVSELLRDGISVNTIDDKGLSPLHQAVLKGNLDMVRLLLWKDADVDLKTPTGWTALHEAAKNSTLEIVDILLHKGANPNAETADGVSPLHYLVSRKFGDTLLHKEVLNSMLEMGADINNAKNANIQTPLHYAVEAGTLESAQFLVEHKANVNMQNKRGYTPLHIAVFQNMTEVVKLLLLYGADKTIACKEGTLEEISKNHPEIHDLITKPLTPVTPPKAAETTAPQTAAPTPNPRASIRVGSVNFLKELESKMKPGTPTSSRPPGEGTLHRARKEQEEVKKIACYFETMTRQEAEELVENAKKSNKEIYLLRPSSVRGCYALTVSSPQEGGTNYLVYPRSGGGYSIEDCDDTNSYPSIKELLEKSLITAGKTAYVKTANTSGSSSSPAAKSPVIDQKTKSSLEEAKKLIEQALLDINNENAWKQTKVNLKTTLQGLSNVL